jgi:hypothetical protein
VRVTGVGEAEIADVVCTVDATSQSVEGPLQKALNGLKRKRDALQQRKHISGRLAIMYENYSSSLNAEYVRPDEADVFFDKYRTRMESMENEKMLLEDEIQLVLLQINETKRKIAARAGKTNAQVVIAIHAQVSNRIELKLTYSPYSFFSAVILLIKWNALRLLLLVEVVQNASDWKPVYELHATTEDNIPVKQVNVLYRARIYQHTGEDWSDLTLTLSTAAGASYGSTIPRLRHPPPSLVLADTRMPVPISQPPMVRRWNLGDLDQDAHFVFAGNISTRRREQDVRTHVDFFGSFCDGSSYWASS